MSDDASVPLSEPSLKAELRAADSAARRDVMVQTVRQMLNAGGLEAVTMRALADRLGISTTMVYSEFPDKATLLMRAIDLDLVEMAKRLHATASKGTNAQERLRLAAHGCVSWGLDNPNQYKMMFMEPRAAETMKKTNIDIGNPQFDPYAMLRGLVQAFINEQSLALLPREVEALTQTIWESIHGVVALRMYLQNDQWVPRLPVGEHVDFVLNVLLDGARGIPARRAA